ncbi:MAG: DUF1643 domain-containing protein [Proteobacteria bacterium]|nr:DUF1643 domain-containing protein [Burkholderiales bacterium]
MHVPAKQHPDLLPLTGFKRRGNRRAGALYSLDSNYRYQFWQRWDSNRASCCFVLLCPNPQEEAGADVTMARLAKFAASADCGGFDVVNLFAYRAAAWDDLERTSDPVGPANDVVLMHVAESSSKVICAWGKHGLLLGRGRAVQAMLEKAAIPLYMLAQTESGHPEHPHFVSHDRQPMRWR